MNEKEDIQELIQEARESIKQTDALVSRAKELFSLA